MLLATGRSAGNDASTPSPEPSETMQASAMQGSDELRGLRVERIFSNAPGLGLRRPSVILTPSASILSGELEVEFPDSGRGAYLTCYWREADRRLLARLRVRTPRREPHYGPARARRAGPGAILTQALTYAYAVALVRDIDP